MDSQPRVVKSQSWVANSVPWSYYIIPARHFHSKILPDERSAFGLLSPVLLAYSYHCDWNCRSLHVIRSHLEDFKTCACTFGKTNLTSSNFPLRLQFSAIGDLRASGSLFRAGEECATLLTILLRLFGSAATLELPLSKDVPIPQTVCPYHSRGMPSQCWNDQRGGSRHCDLFGDSFRY